MEVENMQSGMCHHSHWPKMVVGIFMAIALICLSVFLIYQARNTMKRFDYIGKADLQMNSVLITGEGKVSAIPDVAKIQVGVNTEKATVAEAQKENSDKMNAITKIIKSMGIEDKDIQTAYYYINPKYDYTNGVSKITGYTVSQALNLKIRNTEKISDILKNAADNGANYIGSLSFEIDNVEAVKAQAREKAIADAKVKADALARSLGLKLGRITSYAETPDYTQPVYDTMAKYDLGVGGAAPVSAPPTISQGESEITVSVQIYYELL
jgi:uncharacterized protein YggE